MNKRKQHSGKTIPQPLETLELGEPLQDYRQPGDSVCGWFCEFLMICLFILAVAATRSFLVALAITATIRVARFAMIRIGNRRTVFRLLVFADGIAITQQRNTRAMRWEDISEIRMRSHKEGKSNPQLYDCRLALHVEDSRPTRLRFKTTADVRPLLAEIGYRHAMTHYPDTLAQLQAGETIHFEHWSIEDAGFCMSHMSGLLLAWDQVVEMGLSWTGNTIIVTFVGEKQTRWEADGIPNYHLMFLLARHYTTVVDPFGKDIVDMLLDS